MLVLTAVTAELEPPWYRHFIPSPGLGSFSGFSKNKFCFDSKSRRPPPIPPLKRVNKMNGRISFTVNFMVIKFQFTSAILLFDKVFTMREQA